MFEIPGPRGLKSAALTAALPTFLSFLFLIVPPVPADEPEDSQSPQSTIDDEIVVSAHRLKRPAHEVGSSVTVIDREDIERRKKTTVLELLRSVPGLAVVQGGGPGRTASVFVRGGNSSHTLVLLDGMRLNDNTTGAFDFADLTTDNIERIEILRGPQGTLYGSEAVSGVVSITTRRGRGEPEFWLQAEGGSEAHGRLAAGSSGSRGAYDYSLSLAEVRTEGLSAASERTGNVEEDPWQNTTLTARLGRSFLGDGRINLALRATEGDTEIDGFAFGVGPADAPEARQRREAWNAALTVEKRLAPFFKQTVMLATHRNDLEGKDPDDPFGNFTIESESTEIFSQSEVELQTSERRSDVLTFGLRLERREGRSVGFFDASLDLRSAFVQTLHTWNDRHTLTASVRHDDHEVFGGETTYRVTASAGLSASTRLHGTFATGFKAPTLNDLFFPGFGNPDLEPETSEGFDLGVEQSFAGGDVVVDLTYFDHRFEDLILFTFPGGVQNVAEADVDGFEASLRYEPSTRLFLGLSHTRTDSEDRTTGTQLARRPKDRSVVDVAFRPAKRFSGSATFLIVRDRIDSDGSVMDDYERLDLTLEYRPRSGAWGELAPYLRLENFLDEEYEEIPGFTTPGALFVVGLRLEL